MLLDSFQPEGVTRLAVDGRFALPHLGVFSGRYPAIAAEVLERECLVWLGTCVAPSGRGREGQTAVTVRLYPAGGSRLEARVAKGDLVRLPLPAGQTARAEIVPAGNLDVGAGKGRPLTAEVSGGPVGVIVDARGRPLALPAGDRLLRARLLAWLEQLEAYSPDVLRELRGS